MHDRIGMKGVDHAPHRGRVAHIALHHLERGMQHRLRDVGALHIRIVERVEVVDSYNDIAARQKRLGDV